MKLQLPREAYIPKTYTIVVRAKAAPAVVYMSVDDLKPRAMGFFGNAAKPAFHYNFRTEERRAQYVAEFFSSCEARLARKAERHATRKAFRHTLKVGDILNNSWGYDQTNTEFYEIVQLVGQTMCVLRELACQSEQSGFLSESIVPMPGHYRSARFEGDDCGKPMRRRILEGNVVDIYGAHYGRASLYHRPEPGKVNIMAPCHVSHTH